VQEGSIKRYDRQVLYWGDDFQKILERSSVFIAGVGGLGCIVAEVLAVLLFAGYLQRYLLL
jgi:molybdopterin/thiamine biosynthesis adenylyltransferase